MEAESLFYYNESIHLGTINNNIEFLMHLIIISFIDKINKLKLMFDS